MATTPAAVVVGDTSSADATDDVVERMDPAINILLRV